ncbi:hypothetical protein OROMI_016983 [Orobanche minor]
MQEMENRRRSVNSPQRILSFSRNRKAKVLFQDDQPPHQRPKTSEVYGFVGSITTVVALEYWAIAAPTYAMVTLVLVIGFYIGINFMVTPPPTSFNTIFDEYSTNPVSLVLSTEEDEPPIPPMFDISINQPNQ